MLYMLGETMKRPEPLSANRRRHSLAVAKLCHALALRWGEPAFRAYTAGLLHDLARELPAAELLCIATEYGIEIGREERENPVLLHCAVGALMARELYGVEDEGILSAIAKHTVGDEEMSRLDAIVFLADKTEPYRDYEQAKTIRELAFQDIGAALRTALTEEAAYLNAKGKEPHPKTLRLIIRIKERENRPLDTLEKAYQIKDTMVEKKAEEILLIDIAEITEIAEYFLLCSARNRLQAQAIADAIMEKMGESGSEPLRKEGYENGGWILLDYGSIVVHIFQPEEKEYFKLERLWSDGKFTRFDETGAPK